MHDIDMSYLSQSHKESKPRSRNGARYVVMLVYFEEGSRPTPPTSDTYYTVQ